MPIAQSRMFNYTNAFATMYNFKSGTMEVLRPCPPPMDPRPISRDLWNTLTPDQRYALYFETQTNYIHIYKGILDIAQDQDWTGAHREAVLIYDAEREQLNRSIDRNRYRKFKRASERPTRFDHQGNIRDNQPLNATLRDYEQADRSKLRTIKRMKGD